MPNITVASFPPSVVENVGDQRSCLIDLDSHAHSLVASDGFLTISFGERIAQLLQIPWFHVDFLVTMLCMNAR